MHIGGPGGAAPWRSPRRGRRRQAVDLRHKEKDMKKENKTTDWDNYYKNPFKFAGFFKNFIIGRLYKLIRKHASAPKDFSILEFGAGNSCFYQLFQEKFQPSAYYIVDNNQVGLDAFCQRFGKQDNTILLNHDVLQENAIEALDCDVVFSVGLIEHFSVENTRQSIMTHLKVLKENRILVLGFPTPTFLYRITRKISQWLGMWMFHDERPLKIKEVVDVLKPHGDVLETQIIWPIFLTQAMVVFKKKGLR